MCWIWKILLLMDFMDVGLKVQGSFYLVFALNAYK